MRREMDITVGQFSTFLLLSMIEKDKFYKLKLIKSRFRHGLVLYTVRNFLPRFGLDIDPYYIELEGLDLCGLPTLKDDKDSYTLRNIGDRHFMELYETLGWKTLMLQKSFEGPHQCMGLFRKKELAALMVIRLEYFTLKGKKFELKNNEAFLENMYTYEAFRGRNLAPFLRYRCYQHLRDQGQDVCYSVTQYFNQSSLNFKKKLNAKHLHLYFYLGLFRKFRWNYLLKTYN
ncbi:MAG: GNAT family N-acetyltransferase [Flavobacteriaceae bacterium]